MDKIKENLPLISAFLLIVGALKLIYYYSYFGIDITSYIDLSEILILSLPFFINSTFILVITLLLFTPMTVRQELNHMSDDGKQESVDTKNERIVIGFVVSIILYTIFVLIFTGYADFTITYDTFFATSLVFVFPLLLNYVFPAFKRSVERAFDVQVERAYFITLIIGIGVVTLSILYSRHTARNVLFKKTYVAAEAKLDTVTVKSSFTYRYVGKTKNYIFFYNTETNWAEAWPLSNLKKLTITDNRLFDGILFDPHKLNRNDKGK